MHHVSAQDQQTQKLMLQGRRTYLLSCMFLLLRLLWNQACSLHCHTKQLVHLLREDESLIETKHNSKYFFGMTLVCNHIALSKSRGKLHPDSERNIWGRNDKKCPSKNEEKVKLTRGGSRERLGGYNPRESLLTPIRKRRTANHILTHRRIRGSSLLVAVFRCLYWLFSYISANLLCDCFGLLYDINTITSNKS